MWSMLYGPFFLLLVLFVGIASAVQVTTPKKVLIAGAGPCGLLAAHCLLSRQGQQYDVEIVESREDPRNTEPGPRAYSLGLNVRGQGAIKYFDKEGRSPGLLQSIATRGVESDSFFLHIGKTKIGIRKPSPKNEKGGETIQPTMPFLAPPPPTLLVPRNKLCEGMLENLEALHGGSSSHLKVSFNTKLVQVDLVNGKATVESGSGGSETSQGDVIKETKSYDLIIGADGVQSILRDAIQEKEQSRGFKSEEVVLPSKYKIMLQPCPPGLEADAIHAMEVGKKAGYGLFLIPAPGNQTCALVAYTAPVDAVAAASSGDRSVTEDILQVPAILRDSATADEIRESIATNYPLFGTPSDTAIAQLKSQRLSEARTVRCNRYHWIPPTSTESTAPPAFALLMGDAAHSTGGTLGQGANSALMDIVALDHCLDETKDDLATALTLFSQRQTPEGLALWKLLQLPGKLKGPSKVGYQLSQILKSGVFTIVSALLRTLLLPLAKLSPNMMRGILDRIENAVRRATMPTQNSLSLTTIPFTDIVRVNQFWVNQAMKEAGASNIEYEP